MFSIDANTRRRGPILDQPRRRLGRRVAAIVLASAVCGGTTRAEELEITHLANAGFLLAHDGTRVLIDGLFGGGLPGYPSLGESRRRELEAGRPPFDGVDLALASHFHRDHFDADAVARFLAANPGAVFVSTPDAVDALLAVAGSAAIGQRAFGYMPPEGERVTHPLDGIELTIFNLHHGRTRPEIQNLGLLIGICGVEVLHVGDTEADVGDFRAAGLGGVPPDVALLPSWLVRPSRWSGVVPEVLRPGHVVAMHLPRRDAPSSYFYGGTRDLDGLVAAIRGNHPDAWIPLASGESRRFACAERRD